MITTLDPTSSLVSQVPQRLRETIATLIFASKAWPASKCDPMLACILRYAQVEQLSLEPGESFAKITIQNLLKTYRSDPQWRQTCSYQTLHTYIRLLCALGILRKQGGIGQATSYLLPLNPDYQLQISSFELAAIDRLCDGAHTKNKKVRQKAQEVKIRLLMNAPMQPEKEAVEKLRADPQPPALDTIVQVRLRSLVDSLHLPISVSVPFFQGVTEVCTEVLRGYQQSRALRDSPQRRGRPIVEAEVLTGVRAKRSGKNLPGANQESTLNVPEDVPNSHTKNQRNLPMEDSALQKGQAESTDLGDSCTHLSSPAAGLAEHNPRSESTTQAQNLPALQDQESSLTLRNTIPKENSLEDNVNVQASNLAQIFNDPGSKNFYASVFRDVANKRVDGLIVLAAFIHTLREEQRGRIRTRAGAVFVSIYQRWKSYPSYEVACSVWKKWDGHVSKGIAPNLQQLVEEYERIDYLEIARQMRQQQQEETWWIPEVPVVSQPPHTMSQQEAARLLYEIGLQSSFWLQNAHLRPELALSGEVYVVEAIIVGTRIPVIYSCRDDWDRDQQKQLNHSIWKKQKGVR